MKCVNCGAETEGKFCQYCGSPFVNNVSAEKKQEGSVVTKEKPNQKPKRPIYIKWWFWLILVAVAFRVIGNAVDKDSVDNPSVPATAPSTASEPSDSGASTATQAKKYGNGKYLVGKDIEPGLYKAIVIEKITKMGYIERAKAVSMELSDILANIILTGDGYVQIKNTDVAVKLQGVEITEIDLGTMEKNPQNEVSDGIYLVGYDIKPGTYKVEVTDTITKMGYVERTKNVAMDFEDIIANEIIQGQSYIEIKDTDFAVRLQGVKITLQ